MTLDEFRATRRECVDIGDALNDEGADGVAGYIYADMLWIERTRDGGYHLLIGNSSELGTDLGAFEARLYEFGCSEGYI